MKKHFLLLLLSFLVLSLHANIRLPNILGSNMVLQQQSTSKLWGWASPDEKIKITTSWNNKTIETSADGNANWKIDIQTPQAGGPYTITLQGENKIILNNILIGEVWVCSGQSNMERNYYTGISSIKEEYELLNKLNIRLFNMPKTTSKTPQEDCTGNWTTCDTNALKAFSAVAYYFGKNLNKTLNVPIGLIASSWGGTPAEVWTPENLIENNATLKEASKKNNPTPWWPVNAGYTYNAMIYPIVNYNIAGTIWYQGESNREAPLSYTELMNTMITSWRKAWNKDFPFYYVQIAPYKYDKYNVAALVREAQTKSLSTEKTGMAVISDLVSDTLDIHPTNKKDVGIRLANIALAETYGLKKDGYKSPLLKSFKVNGSNVVVDFDYAETGLIIKGKMPKEIFIAGADKIFYPAMIKIKGSTINVSSKKVKTPVAVRYQFSNAGIGNIFTLTGLPVAPFRTDNWDIDTSKIK
ncbi:sialate O-acetylesterase [Pedobacter sp. HMWF019]|uniref:sialate O-acetylesterase n=1 Tax=Pedobacter sp. HMWF019 TaxID=2056856 RepID=UPI000D384718|nr:sialate O-acetylesterase [Pedobacter sp. HMWF019]PTT01289.1 sialate O-acetylesterase [Pedobacter sp. HMWF019]